MHCAGHEPEMSVILVFNSFDSFSLFLLKLPPPLLLLLLRQSCTLDVIRSVGRVDLLSCCRVRDSGMLTGIYLKEDQTVEGRLLLARVASAQREWYPMLGEMTLSRKTSQPTNPYNTVAYDQCALIKSDNSIPSFHSVPILSRDFASCILQAGYTGRHYAK